MTGTLYAPVGLPSMTLAMHLPRTPEPLRWFIAFMLPTDLETKANEVIADLSNRYGTRTAYAPPHITLRSPFEWLPNDIAVVERAIEAFAQNQAPVPLQLKDFSVFPPRVLFIDVVKTAGLMALQNQLNQHLCERCDLPPDKHRTFNPHVTVASRKLNKPKFKQMWAELENQKFSGEWVGDRLTLLRYEQTRWHLHREFPLSAHL